MRGAIAQRWMQAEMTELALSFPSRPRYLSISLPTPASLRPFYDKAASELASHLRHGRDVALLCEGDPLFYGSFMHIHWRD